MTHPDVDPDRYYLEQALREMSGLMRERRRGNLAQRYEDLLRRMDDWYKPATRPPLPRRLPRKDD